MGTNYPDIANQAEYWDWWEDTRTTNPWALKRADVILKLIESLSLKKGKVIDLGCGTGWFSIRLQEYGEVTAIDLSKRHMDEAKANFPAINFIHGDLFTHPLEKNAFDLVVSQQVIAHVPDQEQYVRLAAELLRPNGWLILSTNNKFVMDRLGEKYDDHKKLGHIEDWLSTRGLKKLLRKDFNILKKISLNPKGSEGILRVVNSYKLNKAAAVFLGKERIRNIKEKMGIGYINIFLAQKKQ